MHHEGQLRTVLAVGCSQIPTARVDELRVMTKQCQSKYPLHITDSNKVSFEPKADASEKSTWSV